MYIDLRHGVPAGLAQEAGAGQRQQVGRGAERLGQRADQPAPQRRRAALRLPHRHAHQRVVRQPAHGTCTQSVPK